MLIHIVIVACVAQCTTDANVDTAERFSWAENVGWMNWRSPTDSTVGAHFGPSFLCGEIWLENAGWAFLGDGSPTDGFHYENVTSDDYGVNIDADGSLNGFAWAENVGWLVFTPVGDPATSPTLGCDGRVQGWVLGENIGWANLNFTATPISVSLDAAAVPLLCDLNGDLAPNAQDIDLFVSVLLMSGTSTWREICSGNVDLSPDRQVNINDIDDFVTCILQA